jgi:hypothetical protein
MPSVALFAATLLLRSACATPVVAMHDTLPVPRDTLHSDTVPAFDIAADTASSARIAFDFGGGIGTAMRARSLELGVSTAPNPYLRNQSVATTKLRFVRRPDSLSAEFARRVASNLRIPLVEVEIRPAAGAPAILVRLRDVQVVSTRLAAGGDAATLRQQWLALTESIQQVRADRDEAERQLTVTASLAKRKLASPVELDRARDAAALLRARLAVQQQRLALVDRQLSDWMPFEEELVLAAASMEAEPGAPR